MKARRIALACGVLAACAARPADAPIVPGPGPQAEPAMVRAQRACEGLRRPEAGSWAACFHKALYPKK